MTNGRLAHVIRYLRRTIAPPEGSGVADAHLLERFVTNKDEAAFELLVYRHGPMVFGVCQRVLGDVHDAEDAFQATMLALARKAGSIGKWNSVGSWLYKVAYRTALRAKTQATKRVQFEKRLGNALVTKSGVECADDLIWQELRPALDESLHSLPEKYRTPFVLCYLEGKTNHEAARRLQWPVGTVKTRLTKARQLLQAALTRRGVVLSIGMMTWTLMQQASATALSARLLSAAMSCSAGYSAAGLISARVGLLTEGVLQTMFMTKLKIATVVLLAAGMAGTGAGIAAYARQPGKPVDHAPTAQLPAKSVGDPKDKQHQIATTEEEIREAKAQLESAEANLEQAKAMAAAADQNVKVWEERLRRLVEGTKKSSKQTKESTSASREPVAYIFDKIPISREELGEYLIARAGNDKLEALVNERIIDHACREQRIEVTDAEVEAALNKDLCELRVSRQEFVDRILPKYHKTLPEWKHDVIRHRILLTKLCRDRVNVSEEDIREAFETNYGEKVECRIVLWPRDAKELAGVGQRVLRINDEIFDALARKHPYPHTATTGDVTVVIARHGTNSPELEKAAFQLQPGELTGLIDTPEGIALLKCVKRIPSDRSKKLSEVRDNLSRQVWDKKIQAEIPKLLHDLRARAQPRLLLKP
jgi:RNA polymerase sigma factor (sigma-70 family)